MAIFYYSNLAAEIQWSSRIRDFPEEYQMKVEKISKDSWGN